MTTRMRAAVALPALMIALAFVSVRPLAADRVRTATPKKTYTWTFAADTLGQPPAFSRAAGRWEVIEDSAATGARLLRQLEAEDGLDWHTLQFLKPRVADQETSVRARIRAGDLDPSVGLAFHLDAKGRNGYLIRVSGRKGELIAHYFLSGKRRDLKAVRVAPPQPGEWHTLGVRRIGERIEVLYDGVVKMQFRDERFVQGNVGLWTEDDTVADFAGLTVTTR